MCAFWFNTAFIENYYLKMEQSEVDKVNKDKSNKMVPKGFFIEVFFESEDGQEGASVPSTPAPTASSTAEIDDVKHSDLLEKYPILNNL